MDSNCYQLRFLVALIYTIPMEEMIRNNQLKMERSHNINIRL